MFDINFGESAKGTLIQEKKIGDFDCSLHLEMYTI